MSYRWEKFHLALFALVGWDSIQERLCHSFIHHLMHVDPEKLPSEIKDDFISLSEDLTSGIPVGSEGRVAAFCDKLSNEEAFDYAKRIVSMYDTITRYEEPFK
jgi:hypothetical protein